MMAAEISGLENPVRAKILATVDGVERLKIVLKELEQKISMVQAKKLTDQITGENDESSKDLKVSSFVHYNVDISHVCLFSVYLIYSPNKCLRSKLIAAILARS